MKKSYYSIAELIAVKCLTNQEMKTLSGKEDKIGVYGFNVLRIFICVFLLQCSAAIVFAQPSTLDPTFGTGGKVVIPQINGYYMSYNKAMAVQTDGKVLMAGDVWNPSTDEQSIGVIRLNTDGSIDNTFGINGLARTSISNYSAFVVTVSVSDIVILSDGKIILSGGVGVYNDDYETFPFFYYARFNSDGTRDREHIISENEVGPGDINGSSSLAVQQDGKILLAGVWADATTNDQGEEITGPTFFKVMRINTNGTMDNSFDGDGKAFFEIGALSYNINHRIKIQSDGKIVLAGSSNNDIAFNYDFVIVRANLDGSPDYSFGLNGKTIVDLGGQDIVSDLAIQTDDKIVVTGDHVNYSDANGSKDYAIVRLNADGTLDNNFDGDGKKLIDFSATEDDGFSVVIQTDGRILMNGDVYNVLDGTRDFGIVRLNENGSFDTSFDGDGKLALNFGPNNSLDIGYDIVLQLGGKIIICGMSQSDQGENPVLARLLNESETIPTNSITETDPTSITYGTDSVSFNSTIFPDPDGGTVQFYINGNPEGAPVPVLGGTASFTYNPSSLNAGVYLIRADFSGKGEFPAATGSVDTLTITKATPTIIYEAASNLIYDGTAKTGSGSATGVRIPADTLSPVTIIYSGTGNTIYGPDTIAPKDAGTYRITASFAGDVNYESFTDSAVAFTIIPVPITISADPQSKTYGDLDPGLSAQVTSGSIVSGDEASGTLSREAGENAGSHPINQGNYTYGANYSETFVPADLSITPRAITITADAKSKVYGENDPVLPAQVTTGNLIAGDVASGTLSRTLGENVGTYAISKGNYTYGTNYSETFISADLSVTTRAITITADAMSKAYGDLDPVLTAKVTAGGVVSGDAASGNLYRVPGEDVGTYLISKGDYTFGPNYNETFNAANLTITLQQVLSFTLVNADNEQDIQTLTNGAVLNLATLPTVNLNIRANTTPATVGRVVFSLTGGQRINQTDSDLPYSLFGDVGGDYNIWAASSGNYTLKATPFTAIAGGSAGTPLTISFSVVNQSGVNQIPIANAGPDKSLILPQTRVVLTGSGSDPEDGSNITYAWTQISGPNQASFSNTAAQSPTVSGLLAGSYLFRLTTKDQLMAISLPDEVSVIVNPALSKPKIVNFSLVNADTDQPIFTLNNGIVLNLATLPTRNLNIRANTFPETIGGVRFTLSGAQSLSQTDSTFPYSLFGDVNGNFDVWVPAAGSYTLRAIPFVNSGSGSLNGTALTIKFSVTNNTAVLAQTQTQLASLPGFQVSSTAIDNGLKGLDSGSDKIRLGAYPNPFGKYAQIIFTVPTDERRVILDVFDLKGSRIERLYDGKAEAHKTLQVGFDGSRLSPGVYLLRLSTSKNAEHVKVIMTE